ncbi:MAG: serine/threonine protein kinase [Ardenticatenaceae bacterium]|nr:serine/threonine protein kinase [Ardenticatenaceae bacterium]HBY95689.1 serine/threonine protein kinase [Chloroflexota bacterium]
MAVAGSLAPGCELRERYHITGLIGQGGMGAVYMANDLRLEGRRTAIKEVSPETFGPLGDPLAEQARLQFHREASILARLDHPNLPKVSDYFSHNGRDYLVMDYVPGRDLKEIVDEARANAQFLDEKLVLEWAGQLGQALVYLHNQRPLVLHRDIKPSNIKLTPSGQIKLVDFGLVKLMVPDDSRTVTVLQGRGTVAYTPLEQYGGDTGHTDVRSDIYSLGATLYHLLTGQPPADAKERFLRPGALVAPRSANPAISRSTEEALLWALEMHPSARPATMAEFMDVLLSGKSFRPLNWRKSPTDRIWSQILTENQTLLVVVVALLLVATFVTWQMVV